MVVAGRRNPPRSGGPAVGRLAARTRRLVPGALRRDPDDRWAAVFGRIALYSFIVAAVSGILLLPFFRPSMAPLTYRGSYRTCGRGSRGTAEAEHVPGAWRPGHRSRSAARSARSGSAARCAATLRTAEHRQRRFPHGLAGQPGASEHPPQGPLIRFPAELGLEDPASLPRSEPGSPFQRRHVAPLGADDPRLRQPPRIGGQEPIIMPDGSVRPSRLTGRWRARALSSAGTGIAASVRKRHPGPRGAGTAHSRLHDLRVRGAEEAASLDPRAASRKGT